MRPQRNTDIDGPRPGTRDLPVEASILADGDDEVVAEPAVTRALHRQNQSLRQTIAVVDRLTAMALDGADVVGITDELAVAIGAGIAVFDRALRALALSDGRRGEESLPRDARDLFPIDDPRISEVLEIVRDSRLPLRIPALADSTIGSDVVVAPIAIGESVLGYLVVGTDSRARDEEDLALLTVQHAASIYALALVQVQRDVELRSRYRAELVESLLLGRAEGTQASELARLAGLRPDASYVVFAIAPYEPGAPPTASGPSTPGSTLLESLAGELDGLDEGVVAVARVDQVTVLAPLADDPVIDPAAPRAAVHPDALSAQIVELVGRRFSNTAFVLGESRPARGPTELRRADVDARRALAVARRLGIVGEVTSHQSLGVHRLLLQVSADELEVFVEDVLGVLLTYDANERASLVETLACYLRHHANLRRTAAELFVHVNTVRYRIQRIEALTNLDLSEGPDRLLTEIAVEALRVLPNREIGAPTAIRHRGVSSPLAPRTRS
jgi:hypothetical protein